MVNSVAILGSSMLASYISEDDSQIVNGRFPDKNTSLAEYALDPKHEKSLWRIPAYHITNKIYYRDLGMHRMNCARMRSYRRSWYCLRCCAYLGLMKALRSLARNSQLYRVVRTFVDVWLTISRCFFMPRTFKDRDTLRFVQ